MEINAVWAGIGTCAGGFFGFLARRQGAYKDQLQIALDTVEKANARVEKLEGKIAGQAVELDHLRRQVLKLENERDGAQNSYEAVQARLAELESANEQMAQQLARYYKDKPKR